MTPAHTATIAMRPPYFGISNMPHLPCLSLYHLVSMCVHTNSTAMRLAGATQSRTSYVPSSYKGPTTTSASGALTIKNGLTTGYPATGVSAAIPRGRLPATTYPHRTVQTSRPYTNT